MYFLFTILSFPYWNMLHVVVHSISVQKPVQHSVI